MLDWKLICFLSIGIVLLRVLLAGVGAMLSSDRNWVSSSTVLSMLSGVCLSRLLLSSLLVLCLSCGSLVLGVSSALAAPSVAADGIYSYCEGDGSTPAQTPVLPDPIVLTGTNTDTFAPVQSICLGMKPDGSDEDDVPDRGPGKLQASDGAKIELGNDEVLYVLGAEDDSIDIEEISTIIASAADYAASTDGLYILDGAQILAENAATGMKIRLEARRDESGSTAAHLASMMVKGEASKVVTVSDLPIELSAPDANDVVVVLVKDEATFEDAPVSGEEGAGRRLVIFDQGVSNQVEFFSQISGSVRVFANSGTTDLGATTNTYTDGTYVADGAELKGELRAFGTGPISIAGGGTLRVTSDTEGNFDNEAIGIHGAASDDNEERVLIKDGAGLITFTKDLKSLTVLLNNEGARLDPNADASTAKFSIKKGTTLYLGGGSSRIVAGLKNQGADDLGTGISVVSSDVSDGKTTQLILHVDENSDLAFDGQFKGITKITKRGKGRQYLLNSSEESSKIIDKVQVDEGELGLSYDFVAADGKVVLKGSSAESAIFSILSHDSSDESNEVIFTANVVGIGTLKKVGPFRMRFMPEDISVSLLHVESGEALLGEPSSGGQHFGAMGIQIDGAVHVDDLISPKGAEVSLEGNDTIIGGLKGEKADFPGKLSGFTGDTPDALPELIIAVPLRKEGGYSYYGEIENVEQIIIDGTGVQKILGKVRRDAVDSDGDLIVPKNYPIVVMKNGELHISSDTFDDLQEAPLKVYHGTKLVILPPIDTDEDADKKFNNSIEGDDRNGYGVIELRSGAKIGSNAKFSDFFVRIAGGDFNFDGINRTVAGLISSDREVSVDNVNSVGKRGVLTLDVPEGSSPVFKGVLHPDLALVKTGEGRQTIDIAEGRREPITLKEGLLVANVRGSTMDAPISTDERYPRMILRLVMWSDTTEIIREMNLTPGAFVRIIPGIDDEAGTSEMPPRKVIYSVTESDSDDDGGRHARIRFERTDFILGKDAAHPARLPAMLIPAEGSILRGTGTVTGPIFAIDDAVVSPGHSIGEITSEEFWEIRTGVSLEIETDYVSPDTWEVDSIAASTSEKGVVIKEGVTLILRAMDGDPKTASSYANEEGDDKGKIIVKNHGEGRFGRIDISDFGSKMQPVITYEGSAAGEKHGNIYLRWEDFNEEKFKTAGDTSEQKGVGAHIDGLGVENPVYQILLALPDKSVPAVLDAFSGKVYPHVMKVLSEASGMVTNLIALRVQEASMQDKMACSIEPFVPGLHCGTIRETCKEMNSGVLIWGGGLLNYGGLGEHVFTSFKREKSGNSIMGGSIAGWDLRLGSGRAGLALASVTGSYEIDESGGVVSHTSKGTFDTYYMSLYLSHYFDKNWDFHGSIGIAKHNYFVSRELSIEQAVFSEEMKAGHSAVSTMLSGEVVKGGLIDFSGDTVIEGDLGIFFRVDGAVLSVGSFSESLVEGTGDIAARVDIDASNLFTNTAGVRGVLCLGCSLPDTESFSLNYMLGLRYNLIEQKHMAKLKFINGENVLDPYASSAPSVSRAAAVLGFSLSVKPVSDLGVSVTLGGLGEISKDLKFDGGFSLRVNISLP